jgi:hypothetical protein
VIGNPLWLIGVNAFIAQKHISKYLKIPQKYFNARLDIFVSAHKVSREKEILVSCVKSQFSVLQNFYL